MKGLSLGWSGLTNLITMTVSVDEGLGVGVYLGFRRALHTVSHHIVIPKLMDTDGVSGQ